MTILSSVWQKLSGKGSKAIAASPAANPSTPLTLASSTELPRKTQPMDSIPDKYSPLWQLLTQRQLIEVKVKGSSVSYQTLIMAIDIQRGLLWLDDLFPSQHLLEIGDQITLRHHRHGDQLCCTAPIVAWGSSYGAQGLAIVLPEHLDYQPRRRYKRADLHNIPSLTAKIRPVGQEISYANVLDISVGGLRVSVAGNMLGQLRHGALIPLCELSLSDELHIRCSARVRAFRLLRSPSRQTQVSLEFVDLSLERQHQLEQFINNLVYLQSSSTQLTLRSA